MESNLKYLEITFSPGNLNISNLNKKINTLKKQIDSKIYVTIPMVKQVYKKDIIHKLENTFNVVDEANKKTITQIITALKAYKKDNLPVGVIYIKLHKENLPKVKHLASQLGNINEVENAKIPQIEKYFHIPADSLQINPVFLNK